MAKTTMAEHNLRNDERALFEHQMESDGRNAQEALLDPAQVIAAAAQVRGREAWYVPMQTLVASSEGTYEFPDTPVLSHATILRFLREPQHDERACVNLDREPYQPHEQGLVRCIAHRLSEKALGPGKGFRLREMLFDDVPPPPPGGALPPDCCYLCHLWLTLHAALKQREALSAPLAGGGGGDPPPTKARLLNRFMVMVNQVGEYDRNRMLTADQVVLGIWGPFPLFNENHYMAVERKAGVPAHFKESAELLFRLPPAAPLAATESSAPSASIQCSPTVAPASRGSVRP